MIDKYNIEYSEQEVRNFCQKWLRNMKFEVNRELEKNRIEYNLAILLLDRITTFIEFFS